MTEQGKDPTSEPMTSIHHGPDLRQHGAWVTFAEVHALLRHDQDALVLLVYLRANTAPWGRFACPNALTFTLGWTEKRLKRVRAKLIKLGHMEMVQAAVGKRPAVYRWGLTRSAYVH
jgi:hypothetical protein